MTVRQRNIVAVIRRAVASPVYPSCLDGKQQAGCGTRHGQIASRARVMYIRDYLSHFAALEKNLARPGAPAFFVDSVFLVVAVGP